MRLFFVLFVTAVVTVKAQPPQVPHKMQFAGMTLTIREDARREIQKDVNALTQSPRHHNIKVERAKTYFPIIEKVFEQEHVPDDFKYLVLQESALIADAVSVSNAVGFWQFKDFTAVEMGLRVDKEIDERMNIVSSSRAAARYIKKNNLYFNNWIAALQAYQMGAGGAMKALPKSISGAREMDITSGTYWYVKKYLAHKIAFEDAVKGSGQIKAIPYENSSKKMLADIAKEVSITEEELKEYNKWARKGTIPDDRTYMVIIPVVGEAPSITLPENVMASTKTEPALEKKSVPVRAERIKINGIKAIKAKAGESAAAFAARAGITLSELLAWNDLPANAKLQPDQYYLLGKKRNRGQEAYHTVGRGEDIWKVSQQYAVKEKKLRRYNRLGSNEEITPGMTLWLASSKPKDADDGIANGPVVEVDNSKTFSWASDGGTPESGGRATNTTENSSENAIPVPTPVVTDTVALTDKSSAKAVDSLQILQPSITVTIPADSAKQNVLTDGATEPRKKEHVVQPKETLYAIAHMYNVGVMELVEWNNLNLQDGIRPGQVLKLSDPAAPSKAVASTLIEHEVKTTDTLYGIARKYGVTIKDLMEWNDKKDFSLAIGEKLKIQGK